MAEGGNGGEGIYEVHMSDKLYNPCLARLALYVGTRYHPEWPGVSRQKSRGNGNWLDYDSFYF